MRRAVPSTAYAGPQRRFSAHRQAEKAAGDGMRESEATSACAPRPPYDRAMPRARRLRSICTLLAVAAIGLTAAAPASAERAYVKSRGEVDLAPFRCETFSRSPNVNRICYDAGPQYLLVSVKGIWYHFCEVPASAVTDWQQAPARYKGQYYNDAIRGRFDCSAAGFPRYR
jgi:hypothetical protein